MPKIQDIDVGSLGLKGGDRATSAAVQAGRGVSAAYGEVASALNDVARSQKQGADVLGDMVSVIGGQVTDFIDHEEISRGMAQEAEMRLNLTKTWNDTLKNADPNNPAVGDDFRQGLDEPLQKWVDSFASEKSRKWATGQAAEMRNHFFNKTVADQSSLAMVAARDNIRTLINTNSTAVALDPTSLPDVMKATETSLKAFVDSNPMMTAEARARVLEETGQKMKEQLVKAAITSAINTNPDAGLKMAQNPEYAKYIDGAEVVAFHKQAKRNEKLDHDLARQRAKQALEDRSNAKLTEVIQNLYDPAQPTKITAKDIAQLPAEDMTPQHREHAIKLIQAELSPEADAKESAVTANDALTGIREGRIDMDDVFKLKETGKITRADFTFLQQQLVTYRDSSGDSLASRRGAFMRNFGPIIDTSNEFTGKTDEAGKRNKWALENELVRLEREFIAAGKDPHSLYDPKSPDYMGSPQALMPYKKTLQDERSEAFKKWVSNPGASPPPPQSAERTAPEPGTVIRGWRFKGGDPSDRGNYEKVE